MYINRLPYTVLRRRKLHFSGYVIQCSEEVEWWELEIWFVHDSGHEGYGWNMWAGHEIWYTGPRTLFRHSVCSIIQDVWLTKEADARFTAFCRRATEVWRWVEKIEVESYGTGCLRCWNKCVPLHSYYGKLHADPSYNVCVAVICAGKFGPLLRNRHTVGLVALDHKLWETQSGSKYTPLVHTYDDQLFIATKRRANNRCYTGTVGQEYASQAG